MIAKTNKNHSHTHRDIIATRKWLMLMAYEGGFATVFIVFTGGAFLTGLALMWGAGDFEIGLLAALPFLAQAAQLISAYLVDKSGKRKTVTFWGLAIGRQLWWIVVPLLFVGGDWRLHFLIILMILSSVSVMIATPGWLSWMADLVPQKIRGRYFGVRSAAVAAATIVSTIIGGLILDQFKIAGHENMGFAVIISTACIFALAALILLGRIPDKAQDLFEIKINLNLIMAPFKDANYRFLLKVFFVWNMAIGISAAFFVPHMLINLSMNFTQISFYLGAAALTAILLNKPWGSVIDRFGSKPVLAFCAFGIVLVPLLWYLPRPDFLWAFAFETVYSGALWAGFGLAAFNIPIANSPKDKRIMYLAMFSVVTGLGFFIASFLGGALAESLSFIQWQVGDQTIVNYHILFTLSAVLRLLAAFLSLKFHEPREKRIPIMIQFIGYSVLKRLSVGRQIFPWALSRKERESTDPI